MCMPSTNSNWILRAEAKYPGRFDYSKCYYVNSYHKVTIICKEHDEEFLCSPVAFLRTTAKGDNCPICRHNRKLTQEEFLDKAKNNYGHVYDLSKVVFKTTRDSVVLGCYEHGDFEVPARFVSSNDNTELCPKCKTPNLGYLDYVKRYTEDVQLGQEPGIFYELLFTHKRSEIQFIKVGITSRTIEQRYPPSKYPEFSYDILNVTHGTNLETALLEQEYSKNNIDNKFKLPKYWNFEGRTECYNYSGYTQMKAKQVKFIRDAILLDQRGICPLCDKVVTSPVLDHWHTKRNYGTGQVRGVLCSTCNRLVGAIENSAPLSCIDNSDLGDVLRNTADYLERDHYPYIHPTEEPVVKITKTKFNALMKKYIDKYPTRKPLKYPKGGRAGSRLKEVIKEFDD